MLDASSHNNPCVAAQVAEAWTRFCSLTENRQNAEQSSYMSSEDIEDSLLQPWAPAAFSAGKMDMGQVLHGCCAILRLRMGKDWCKKVALVNALCEERLQRLLFHPTAGLVLGILFTDHHWALLAYVKGSHKALVYDGLKDQRILDAGVAFMFHVEAGTATDTSFANVPQQCDEWSCGHRVILHLNFLLKHMAEGNRLPEEVPPGQVSCAKIQVLISSYKTVCVYQRSADAPGTEDAAETEDMPVTEDSLQTEDDADSDSSCFALRPAKCLKVSASKSPDRMDLPTTPVASKKSVLKNRLDVQWTPDSVDPMQQPMPSKRRRVSDSKTDKEPSTPPRQKRDMTCTKSSIVAQLRDAGIDHNVVFQSAHERGNRFMEKGHWNTFTKAVCTGDALACPVCADLRLKFEEAGKSETLAVCQPAKPKCSAVPRSTLPSSRSRGRPSKEEDQKFDLVSYIREHRANVYTPIENNEAKPGYPWWCVPCQKTVNLQRRGSASYLDLHEGRRCHLRACAKLGISVNGIRDTSSTCNGVKLTDSIPWLGRIQESFADWYAAGMPWACTEHMKTLVGLLDSQIVFSCFFMFFYFFNQLFVLTVRKPLQTYCIMFCRDVSHCLPTSPNIS